MAAFLQITSRFFDVLLAPFGHRAAAFDLIVWPIAMGFVALLIVKAVSNQKAIASAKQQIGMRLLEIRLFQHDIRQVIRSTGAILWKNTLYVGNNILPMLVMTGPMLVVLTQLVANYAYAPAPSGSVEVLSVELDGDPKSVTLDLPPGVVLDAPPVRTADGRAFWRLRSEVDGDHVLAIRVGGETLEKVWSVGGAPRKVPEKRLRGIEAFLYPGEAAIPSSSVVERIEIGTPHVRELRFFPDGEGGILGWFFVLSLVAGFALKDVVGVTL
jgi:hypothetical protein